MGRVESLTYAYDHAPRRQRVVELDRGHVDGHAKRRREEAADDRYADVQRSSGRYRGSYRDRGRDSGGYGEQRSRSRHAHHDAEPAAESSFVSSPAVPLHQSGFKAGYVFHCNNDTVQECVSRRLFGSRKSDWDCIRHLDLQRTALFLYNFSARVLYGVYLGHEVGLDLDLDAWQGRFPAQVRVSSLYELEPLPLRAALDAIGGDARATGKLPLRLMQAEVDRLLEQMPEVPREGRTHSPVRAPGYERPAAPDAPSYPSAYEPPPLNDRYQAADDETLSPLSPVPPKRSSINMQPYMEVTTAQGAARPSGHPKSPRSSRSQSSNSKCNNNEERYEMTVYGERHRVRREYDPIPDEDDGYVCNGIGGVPADYD